MCIACGPTVAAGGTAYNVLLIYNSELLEDAASEPRHTTENADNTVCTCADCALMIAVHLSACRFILFSVTNSDVCQAVQPPLPSRPCY
jgi:hypothetical protein